MARYKALAVTTKFWRLGSDPVNEIIQSIRSVVRDGDIVVVSEKAISTAIGNVVDETDIKPTLASRLIARVWMRVFWGYLLGPLLRFRSKMLKWLRHYPIEMGSRHKEVVLRQAGIFQALMFGSEGAVDGSNLAYSYVSLPLENPQTMAQQILNQMLVKLGKQVIVMIVDTDKTYSIRNFHFTPRPNPMKGIFSFGGFVSYVVGRLLKFKRTATPVAVAGLNLSPEEALRISNIADHARGHGAGKTVWDMAEKLGVRLDKVTWEMLETARHKPIVIVRRKK